MTNHIGISASMIHKKSFATSNVAPFGTYECYVFHSFPSFSSYKSLLLDYIIVFVEPVTRSYSTQLMLQSDWQCMHKPVDCYQNLMFFFHSPPPPPLPPTQTINVWFTKLVSLFVCVHVFVLHAVCAKHYHNECHSWN